ncbi:MAG: hypothetical protein ACRCSC_01860 [Lactococcus garvieae]
MTLTFKDITQWESRIQRQAIGIRKLPPIKKIGQSGIQSTGGGGGFSIGGGITTVLGMIWNGFSGFLFLVGRGLLSGLAFTFTGAFSLLVQSTTFLANFDWNASDKEIDAGLQSRWKSWASTLGTGVGGSLGWFACGILPNAAIFAFDPGMGAYVLTQFGEEAQEELAGYLVAIIRQSMNIAVATAFASTYKTVRSILKASPVIQKLFPGIKKWGADNGPTFTISKSIEDAIEKIPNPFVRNFTEAAYEEFFDACIDAGFTLTSAMDSYIAMNRAANTNVSQEILEIKPDRESDEKLYLAGSRDQLKTTLPQTLANYHLIKNRDIGDVFETPLTDYIQSAEKETITLHLSMHSRQKPPYGTGNKRNGQRVTIKIPKLKRSSLDWSKIKKAAGAQGYQYGKYGALVKLTNGRQYHVYASSSQFAIAKAKELIELSEAEIKNISVTELTNEGERRLVETQQKGSTVVYPHKAKITRVIERADKQREIRTISFDLWPDNEPADFKEKIELLFLPPRN